MRELNRDGTTIILTTHYLEEAEELCARIGIIEAGKLVALENDPQAGRRAHAARRLPGADAPMIVTDRRPPPELIGFLTLVKREMVRTFSIINQVIWPPVIQTLLYVFVFGLRAGQPHPDACRASRTRSSSSRA